MYKCPTCAYTAEAAGTCPTCNVALVEATMEAPAMETPAAETPATDAPATPETPAAQ